MDDNRFILNPFFKLSGREFKSLDYLKKIYSYLEVDDKSMDTQLIKKTYQAVIMAAGKGSRMNLNYPKSLSELNYPYGKFPIIENILLTLKNIQDKLSVINIVIKEGEKKHFEYLQDKYNSINIIELPVSVINGTAYCLYYLKDYLRSKEDILLMWGDVAFIPIKYLFITLLIHEKMDPSITMPTRYKYNPYVAFERDKRGVFSKVYHSNENEKFCNWAEQDALSFLIKEDVIKSLGMYLEFQKNTNGEKELDLVHYIPYYASSLNKAVIGLPICESEYVHGMNTIEKSKELNNYLSNLSTDQYKEIFFNIA